MKRLTGVTVILAGIGAVGGVFGMSEAANAISGAEGSGFYIVVLITVLAAAVGRLVPAQDRLALSSERPGAAAARRLSRRVSPPCGRRGHR